MTSPAIILIRPREEGNVGAVARAMANMGLERLILVEPAPQLGGVARGFGVGGWQILDRVTRAATFTQAAAPFNRLVATASRRQRSLRRQRVVTPRQLPQILSTDPPDTATALVFGPEDNGLQSAEIELCNPVVTIPCAPEQPTLNLAQAVLVVAYELFAARHGQDPGSRAESSSADERETLATVAESVALTSQVDALLPAIGFDQAPIRAGMLRDLNKLLVRSDPSSREVRILRRLCNRAAGALARRDAPDNAE